MGLAVFMGFGILVIVVHYLRKGKETA